MTNTIKLNQEQYRKYLEKFGLSDEEIEITLNKVYKTKLSKTFKIIK